MDTCVADEWAKAKESLTAFDEAENLYAQAAGQLFVSEFTINTHRRNICRKLNVYTPVELLNFAKEHGLI